MLKNKLLTCIVAALACVQAFAYNYDMTITATRGPGLSVQVWDSLRSSLETAYANYPNPSGVNLNFGSNESVMTWTWTGQSVSTVSARDYRDTMQNAFDSINESYRQAQIDIVWSFSFDGEGSTPVESAQFEYPSAVELGSGWVYSSGFESFYVGSWPWVYNYRALVWYYNSGNENNLWCYVPGEGWGYTNALLFPWVFQAGSSTWVWTEK